MSPEPKKTPIVDDEGWETVAEESGEKIEFPSPGSSFVGVYTGTEFIVPEGKDEEDGFNKHLFRDSEGKVRYLLGGFKIDAGLADVHAGETARITYVGSVDVGQPAPMKDYRIEVKR